MAQTSLSSSRGLPDNLCAPRDHSLGVPALLARLFRPKPQPAPVKDALTLALEVYEAARTTWLAAKARRDTRAQHDAFKAMRRAKADVIRAEMAR